MTPSSETLHNRWNSPCKWQGNRNMVDEIIPEAIRSMVGCLVSWGREMSDNRVEEVVGIMLRNTDQPGGSTRRGTSQQRWVWEFNNKNSWWHVFHFNVFHSLLAGLNGTRRPALTILLCQATFLTPTLGLQIFSFTGRGKGRMATDAHNAI